MTLKSDFKTFSPGVNSTTLTFVDSEEQNLQLPQSQYTELIGGYVSNEMLTKPPRPLHDAQKYLRRRVAEIAAQIRDSCSAHHFERHVVEIDELLRCDAPLGFTPSMVLAGVPDILCILCNALLRGYLLHPADAMDETMRALTPVRMSPVSMKVSQRHLTEPTEATPKKSAGNRTPSQKSGMSAMQKSAAGRSLGTLKQSTSSGKTIKLSVVSCAKEGDDADIRPFLPPLIRRPIGFVESSENVVGGSTVGGTLKLTDTREQQQAQAQQSQQQQTLEGYPEGSTMHMIPRQSKSNIAATSTGNDAVALTHIALTDARQIQPRLSAQRNIRSTSVDAPPHVSLLRDIPSALQALLYHCALPLVCLTAEDQRQRLTAVRALASAMASMLHVTKEAMKDSADATTLSRDDTAPQWVSGTLDGNDSSSDDDDGVRLNLDGDSASNTNGKTIRYIGGMGVSSNPSQVSFCIRRAALDALHTLLSVIDTEEETRTNQHFSARDKRRYDMSECGDTYTQQQQQQLLHHHDPLLQDGSSTAAHEHHTLSESNVCPARTLPLSVPNGALAVDVLIPLLERWTTLLNRRAGNNALLDSARHNSTRRDPLPMAPQSRTVGPTVVVAAAKAAEVENSRYKTKSPRISSNDAAELHLILRICLQLSTYRHHARALIQPQDRTYNLLHTADAPRVMGLPILLCLTMARCAEGDRCLSLCVDCLWNLLEILPEETVRSILQHESEDPQQPFITTDTRATANKGVEKNKTSSYMLSSLSASECLLHTFTQILLSGHRAEQRELRNDFVVLLLLIYRHDTSVLGCEERNLRRRLFAAHGHYKNKKNKSSSSSPREQDTEEHGDDPRTVLSARTLDAMSGIAMTVFDIVCGPELSISGATERAAQRGLPAHLSRHHTVMSPATRVENLQFKLLGWRMLEAFHAWEATRNAISGLRQRLLSYAQGNPCALIQSSSYNMKSTNTNNNDNSNCGKDESVFGMFHYGLIDVLLRYVDMRCENALIVSWTREELFTLQSEAWRVLLALLGSAVDRHAANRRLPRRPRVFMKSNEAPHASGKLPSSHNHAVVPEENGNAADVKGSQGENVQRCLSANDGRDREEIHYPNDGHLDTTGCIMLEKEEKVWKEDDEAEDEEDDEEGSDIDNISERIDANRLFVDYGGISCALSYIYSAPPDAEENVCLALRVLSALSRHPSHRRVMFAAAPPIEMQDSETANVSGGVTRDAEAMASPKSTLFVLVMGLMKKCIENTHAASTRRRHMKEEEKVETTRRRRQTQITETPSKHRDNGKKIVSFNAVAADSMVMSTASKTQSKGHTGITFTAQGYEVLIHGLLLLYNMAEGPDNVLEIRECFMSLGGIELLLSLIRYALPSLAHRRASNTRELLTALLNCVRVFVLESAVARRQFVLDDGVHLLLSVIGAFAAQSSTQKHKSLRGLNVGEDDDDDEEEEFDDDDEEKEEFDYYEGGNDDLNIDRTWGWGKNALPIVYALTILSDLLSESDEAREEFLSWNRPPHCNPIQNQRMHHTPTDDGDDGRMNATQLLLSLWIDDPTSLAADDKEPQAPTTAVRSVASPRDHSSALTNVHVSPSGDRRASRRRNDAFHEDLDCPCQCQCKKTEKEEDDEEEEECTLCAMGSHNPCAPAVTECERHSIPVLRADRWGLAAIPGTFVSRASIINELRRRFAELSMHSEETAAVLAAGAPAAAMGSYSLHIRRSPPASASQKSLSLTSATSPMTKQAQRRLALALCQVLGIRVKIFACLSAIGFDRLSEVRASALERVKLLHLASLPVVCRDEVWAAMAETVDFNGRAWVVPASPRDITPSEDIKQAHKPYIASGAYGPDDAEDVIRPIAPDAARLVQVMFGVDARAEELRGLVSASFAAGNAHEEECTLRFLIARMRRGDDNARVATLVRLARGRHAARTQSDTHAKANTLEAQGGSSPPQSWSVVDSFIHRARQGKEGKYNARPYRPQSPPNEESMNRSRGRPPVAPLFDLCEYSATSGDATIPPPRMTVMERKKKRSLMISTSKQFANRRPGKPEPLSVTPKM